jgi:hypothetical protein
MKKLLLLVIFLVWGSAWAEVDSCTRWKEWMYPSPTSPPEALRQYDTLRTYIERCASEEKSYQVFGKLNSAVHLYAPDDTTRYDRYRDWLISVIYFNPSDIYFCSVIGAIGGTYQYGGKYPPTMAALAVLNYLRKGKCGGSGLDKKFTQDSLYAISKGWDPTNLPPLDSLGLGFLLKSGVTGQNPLSKTYLASFIASPNPFSDGLLLNFQLNRASFIRIQVFDVLGKVMWETQGRTFDAGDHELSVDAGQLERGSYYARITNAFGEVRTVKLVKE